jgi:hypothetical protein
MKKYLMSKITKQRKKVSKIKKNRKIEKEKQRRNCFKWPFLNHEIEKI